MKRLKVPALLLGLAATMVAADTPPPTPEQLAAAVKAAQSAGDNAWMLVSTALVLMMTGPGLALFYGGLVRMKNVLGTMMQSLSLMALSSVTVVGNALRLRSREAVA